MTMHNQPIKTLHLATHYHLDERGRMVAINELDVPPAPRFCMGRTTVGNSWHFRHDCPDSICQEIEKLCQAEPIPSDLATLPEHYHAIRQVLEQDAPIQREYRGPAYWVPEQTSNEGSAILLDASNMQWVEPHFYWLLKPGEFQNAAPVAAVIEEGKAVSICFCSRIPCPASEAGLNTVEAYRGRGYGAAAVVGWATALRQQGCIPLYSTAWDNLASQAVARKMGMVCYGEDWRID